MEGQVVIATFFQQVEADVAYSVLESAGIPARIVSDDAGGAYPFLQATRGIRIVVAPEDEERARKALEPDEEPGDSSA